MRNAFVLLAAIGTSLIATLASAKDYKGAEIYSFDSYTYGRYEMRMRAAKGGGILSTFFTYKNGSEIGGTFWEEIDIEIFGKDNATSWQSNIILGSTRPTEQIEIEHDTPFSLGDAYHTYVIEWTPDYVAWFVDGEEIRRIEGTSAVTSLTNPQSLRFNLWASESVEWTGAWDDSVLPAYQFVNYIEYKAYNATTKTFEGGWRDDFNTFNELRWGKANWTFDTNRVDFAPENVVVKDGILVLALTKNNALGFTGTPPADDGNSSSSATSSIAPSSSAASSAATSSAAPASSAPAASSVAAASSKPATSGNSGGGGGGSVHWLGLVLLGGLFCYRHRTTAV